LHHELNELLTNKQRRDQVEADYAELTRLLSDGGQASARAAQSITRFLTSTGNP
jgi:lipid A disaccharide synthetase